MTRGVNKLTCTDTHIGMDVPDEQAFPALKRRLMNNSQRMPNGCLEWTGWRTATGYGTTAFRGRSRPTHKLMFMVTKGPVPDGMQVLHSCDNPPCMEPDHLSAGTGKENMRQARERNRHHEAEKTHCDRGHPFSGDNLYEVKGHRHCKTCTRARSRIRAGWPADLAFSTPAGRGSGVPEGMVRVTPKTRKRQSSHCTKGHELAGRNRYVTPQGNVECRRCRQIARDAYGEKRRKVFSGEVGK